MPQGKRGLSDGTRPCGFGRFPGTNDARRRSGGQSNRRSVEQTGGRTGGGRPQPSPACPGALRARPQVRQEHLVSSRPGFGVGPGGLDESRTVDSAGRDFGGPGKTVALLQQKLTIAYPKAVDDGIRNHYIQAEMTAKPWLWSRVATVLKPLKNPDHAPGGWERADSPHGHLTVVDALQPRKRQSENCG